MSNHPTIDREALAYALKRRLRERGLTYEQAADEAGVNRGHLIGCLGLKDIHSSAFVRLMCWLETDLVEDNIEIINRP